MSELDPDRLESLACALLVVVAQIQRAPQDVRAALDRAEAAGDREQWRQFTAETTLEALAASADT